ncbi:MAG: acyltransferase [Mucilaginibacter sp.]|nr:acyltransferase [Mucilaginibacter sp.]
MEILLEEVVNPNSYKRKITAPALKHIAGIDQLRYVFALWVFLTHGGAPPIFTGHAKTQIFDFLDHLYGWSINGQAAVMGFFIVSGLCIHYPNIRRDSFNIKSFYAARFLRLSLPLLACLAIAKLLNFHHPDGFLRVVPIWTLYCEAIYYVVYPFVLWIVKKGYLIQFIMLTGFISVVLIIIWSNERSMYFHEIGGGGFLNWKAALLAFPCWLLGVLLAERISFASIINKVLNKKAAIWWWRLGALILSTITFPVYRYALYFHLINKPIIGLFFTSQFTILLFGLYAFFWIEREVVNINFGKILPSQRLEKMGAASYSLYLVHLLVIWLFAKMSPLYFPGYLLNWLLLFVFLHIAVFLFFIVFEKPSHKLSKFCANALRRK